ncbi:carbamoyltransferase HypF [Rubrobacter tropicus]|uniref:carbamoyltransferase HypF n=1 Tax=Rubrobacter tropicus TaxID=2653851 RepID=UPI001A9CC029|nr:carbamoyltransferase HypF [Rubrobacter tropicus]
MISVRGIVQGVGFRPFVYALARRHGIAGLVRNDADGVRIEAEGHSEGLELFTRAIEKDPPPLAVVESVSWSPLPLVGEDGFRIEESREATSRSALVSPDVATCGDCLAELFDPSDRRHRYPFINCTSCGPRFTITRQVPYDRATTTMSSFGMCPDCDREYHDPADRRFHAQPNACPTCGPRVRLLDRFGHELAAGDPIASAARMLRGRAILAVKGLGGYHLACDPFDDRAVRTLRGRKARRDKPFALMARDIDQARLLCHIGPDEETLLTSPTRPIVLLERRSDVGISERVAPRQKTLGVMLAYTPLHHLLLDGSGIPLVMTSGNNSDEPIAYRDDEALGQLGDIADFYLVHDRPVHVRCDDSVVRVLGGRPYPLRRSRGYAPAPLRLTEPFGRQVLAVGGELKNTFALARGNHAFPSHHVGDLENYETLRSFREGIEHYCGLFDVRPDLVAHDLHPEYLSTKYARELEEAGMPAVGVQHHHAHVASCLADNDRPSGEYVIGVALDGTGYGPDGAVWGGEFFGGSVEEGFTRLAHLQYAPLPGGAAAIRQPWRVALAHLLALYGEEDTLKLPLKTVRRAGETNVRLISRLIERQLNTPPTSSAGRLFDAVAALVGVPGSTRATYEGRAAVELELAAEGPTTEAYPFWLRPEDPCSVVETNGIIAGAVEDLKAGRKAAEISAKFHRTMAEVVAACCETIRESTGVGIVALSGGTFQNALLTGQTMKLLKEGGFAIHTHRRVPTNDGGLALGQAILADRAFANKLKADS